LNVTVQWAAGEDEVLCLVSTLPADEQPHVVYEMRYWIETLFGSHKSRGFQLARTHMTTPEHSDRLVLALAIATCLVLGLGTHLILLSLVLKMERLALLPRIICVRRITILRTSGLLPALHP